MKRRHTRRRRRSALQAGSGGAPKLPKRCPAVVEQFLREPSLVPQSTPVLVNLLVKPLADVGLERLLPVWFTFSQTVADIGQFLGPNRQLLVEFGQSGQRLSNIVNVGRISGEPRLPEQFVDNYYATFLQLLKNCGARGDRWGNLTGNVASNFSAAFGDSTPSAVPGLSTDAAITKFD